MRRAIRMGERHRGHPLSNAAAASAHAAQKRECPQGTSATAERGWSRHTSQVSPVAALTSSGDVAAVGSACRERRRLLYMLLLMLAKDTLCAACCDD